MIHRADESSKRAVGSEGRRHAVSRTCALP